MIARNFLLFCMMAGLLLALAGVVTRPAGAELPTGVLARVGTQELRLADYQRTINGLQAERRAPLDASARKQVLDRMIDEYLLLEHARRLDLAREVPALRKQLVDQVLEVLRAQARSMEPDETQLEKFYAENRAYFANGQGADAMLPESIREVVVREWQRRTAEDLLRDLLLELRREIPVQVREAGL